MSFERDFLAWMNQTVTYNAYTGLSTDGYSARTYSTDSRSIAARIEMVRRIVKGAEGRDAVSNTTVLTPPYDTSSCSLAITVADKITLPSGFLASGSSTNPIIFVEPHYDEDGLHHFEVLL